MKTDADIKRELESLVASDGPLNAVVERLREFRRLGAGRDEVESLLEAMRAEARDEATEDRILEILDFVTGFCRAEDVVWES